MIKNVVIFVLFTYSVIVTYKYFEKTRECVRYKIQFEEFCRRYEFRDTSRVKIVEKAIERKAVKYVPVARVDTFVVYQTVFQRLRDTLWTSFSWTFGEFLKLRDSVGLYQTDSMFYATVKRFYKIERTIDFYVHIYEKEAERFWYSVWVSPVEAKDFVSFSATYEPRAFRFYSGVGVNISDKIYLYLRNQIVIDRFGLGLAVSKRGFYIDLAYRLK